MGVAVAAVGMAWLFGRRTLNAVAVGTVVAVAVGLVQLRFADRPTVSRSVPGGGFPGETRTVSIDIEGTRGTIVRVRDALSAGLAATDNDFAASLPATRRYEVTLTDRGRRTIGPTTVWLRDALGLFEREIRLDETTPLVVYPPVHDVGGSEHLWGIVERRRAAGRSEIDRLREYQPGDPLRDVAWKASAKRHSSFVVVEFAGRETAGAVEIALDATPRTINEAASAAASVALFLLDQGLDVGLVTPGSRIEPSGGGRQRRAILAALAEAGAGTTDGRTRGDADVRIVGEDGAVTVGIEGLTIPFRTVRTGERDVGADRDRPEVSAP